MFWLYQQLRRFWPLCERWEGWSTNPYFFYAGSRAERWSIRWGAPEPKSSGARAERWSIRWGAPEPNFPPFLNKNNLKSLNIGLKFNFFPLVHLLIVTILIGVNNCVIDQLSEKFNLLNFNFRSTLWQEPNFLVAKLGPLLWPTNLIQLSIINL